MRSLSLAILAVMCILIAGAEQARASSCLSCHPRSEKISDSHPLSCVECHGGNPDDFTQAGAHEGRRANPADHMNPDFACGRCHQDQAERVNRTLMSTVAGIISQTRFLLGAQKDVKARYAIRDVDDLQMLHNSDDSGPIANDLLRRRCLRCHLGAVGNRDIQGSKLNGPTAAGCAACHILDKNTGIGPDHRTSYAPGGSGAPSSHLLTTAMPTTQCLQCHNGNRVGADFAGLFERDHSLSYNFEATDPEIVPHLMKHSYHYLLPDIHHERGMHCIDCHPVEELMGEGKVHAQAQEQVGVRCHDCHGLPGKPPRSRRVTSADSRALRAAKANPHYDLQVGSKVIETSGGHLLTNTIEKAGNFLLTSKVDGKIHKIPVLGRELPGKEPLNHRIPGHLEKMECTACHAAWTFQDLGLHLVRQDYSDYEPWIWLTRQGDPQARDVLETNLFKPKEHWSPPSSRDWLTGFPKVGVWLGGYSMRRWEGRILGVNSRGRVSAMRPQYQYWLSWVDSRGQTILDSVIPRTGDGRQALAWNPYAPHTVRPQTVDCWDCHGNTRALGLGQTLFRAGDGQVVGLGRSQDDGLGISFDLDKVIDEKARALQITSRTGAGFLSAEHLEKMSARNPLYIKYLLEFFEGKEAWGDPAGFTGPGK